MKELRLTEDTYAVLYDTRLNPHLIFRYHYYFRRIAGVC